MGSVQELSDATFENVALKGDKPVLVDFWAPWCGPCRMVGPIVEAIAEKYGDKIVVGKVNVDDAPAVATKYGIRSIPTLICFKGGEVAEQMIGLQSEAQLSQMLDRQLGG